MPTTDPRIDAYIDRAAPFAQPILAHLRTVVHAACPGVQEAIKWGMPFFVLADGRILGHMAAFKQQCAFGFWRGRGDAAPARQADEAMGQFGRLASIADLPPTAELKRLVKAAAAPADAAGSAPAPARRGAPKPALPVPPDLSAALAGDADARRHFDAFTPGRRNEYIEWIVEAKRAETRAKRVAQAIGWLADGKPRHWKYQDC